VKKGKNKYIGSWTEPISKKIELPFSIESMLKVLTWGAKPGESAYTHQDIAHWCDRFRTAMFDTDADSAMDIVTAVAADVDAQWDMFLANSYELKKLQELDFSEVRMPLEFFEDWLKQLADTWQIAGGSDA